MKARLKTIKIHSPIWKTRSIGIATYKLCEGMIIEIDYKTKEGKRLYPGKYTISLDKALSYPIQTLSSGMRLKIIPIDDLERMDTPPKKKTKIIPDNSDLTEAEHGEVLDALGFNELPGATGDEIPKCILKGRTNDGD